MTYLHVLQLIFWHDISKCILFYDVVILMCNSCCTQTNCDQQISTWAAVTQATQPKISEFVFRDYNVDDPVNKTAAEGSAYLIDAAVRKLTFANTNVSYNTQNPQRKVSYVNAAY